MPISYQLLIEIGIGLLIAAAIIVAARSYGKKQKQQVLAVVNEAKKLRADADKFRESVQQEREKLDEERNQLKQEREVLNQERDTLARQRENLVREAAIAAKEESHRILDQAETEAREKRAEVLRLEQRLLQREELLEHRFDVLEQKEHILLEREAALTKRQGELRNLLEQQKIELERISGLTWEQAREILLQRVRDDLQHEAAMLVRQMEEEVRLQADRRAREIILDAVQRCTVEHVSQNTVSVVHLPNDDMKGRIIGREGRNIRHFEQVTGVDLIIDDTPEAVVLSCFDPVRREIARLALTNLIVDGRIHPTRIEEEFERSKTEIERRVLAAGEDAVLRLGLTGVHPDIVRVLGKLKFRTSYTQNVLDHSLEVAHLAAGLAAELKVNVQVVKRAALMHDIGKALESATEGPHAVTGMEFLRRHGEAEIVCNAVGAHHFDIEPASVEAYVLIAADTISAARPGARRESLEQYLKRLEQLERIADSFVGVEKSYAIQAGREIRVIVKPDQIDDLGAHHLARSIAKKIQEELEYPGQIKVTVIRETRAQELAK